MWRRRTIAMLPQISSVENLYHANRYEQKQITGAG